MTQRAPRRAALAARIGFVVIAISLTAANPPQPETSRSEPLAAIVPLMLTRSGPQPVIEVRELSLLQDQIGAGDKEAFQKQQQVAAEVEQRLRSFPVEVWNNARNRLALIKFTLSGGNPELQRSIAERKLFTESEVPLVRGSLAYAEGFREQALIELTKVDITLLGPSLAGHVSLVKAILVAETDPASAQIALRLARLSSPGTLVEEAALRLAVELDIRLSDNKKFEADAARYLRRYQMSAFAPTVLSLIGAFTGSRDYVANAAGKAWLEQALNALGTECRSELLFAISEYALRYGKLATAAYASRKAAAIGAEPSKSAAFEGAALVIGPNPAKGLALLAAAEAFAPEVTISELVTAARGVGSAIQAPPISIAWPPSEAEQIAQPKSAQLVKARQLIDAADKLLEETIK